MALSASNRWIQPCSKLSDYRVGLSKVGNAAQVEFPNPKIGIFVRARTQPGVV